MTKSGMTTARAFRHGKLHGLMSKERMNPFSSDSEGRFHDAYNEGYSMGARDRTEHNIMVGLADRKEDRI